MKTLVFRNGDQMPIVGLGTWKSKPGEVYAAVREAIRIGYRHLDCALIYGNEEEIGKAVQDAIGAREVTRKELWLTSKLWGNAHGRDNVGGGLEKSLRNLGLDYLDLYLIHWPIALQPDVQFPRAPADFADIPLASTWAGMEQAASAGLTRHIGVSNFSIDKLNELLPVCKERPEVNQFELHPFFQQSKLVTYCMDQQILITAYSPLGSSDRPEMLRQEDEPSLLQNRVIAELAEARGCTPAQLLLAWHVQRGIAVIPKSITPSRLRENLAAADIELSASDLAGIASLDRGFRFVTGEATWVAAGGPWTRETIWDEG